MVINLVNIGIFSEFVSGGLEGDKHFTYTQASPSAIWNIQHNLNKNPSVSIVDTAGSQVYTDVEYIDNNNLRLTFFAAFSGKAYMN